MKFFFLNVFYFLGFSIHIFFVLRSYFCPIASVCWLDFNISHVQILVFQTNYAPMQCLVVAKLVSKLPIMYRKFECVEVEKVCFYCESFFKEIERNCMNGIEPLWYIFCHFLKCFNYFAHFFKSRILIESYNLMNIA